MLSRAKRELISSKVVDVLENKRVRQKRIICAKFRIAQFHASPGRMKIYMRIMKTHLKSFGKIEKSWYADDLSWCSIQYATTQQANYALKILTDKKERKILFKLIIEECSKILPSEDVLLIQYTLINIFENNDIRVELQYTDW